MEVRAITSVTEDGIFSVVLAETLCDAEHLFASGVIAFFAVRGIVLRNLVLK